MKTLLRILPAILLFAVAGCKPKQYTVQQVSPYNTRINTQDTAHRPDSGLLKIIAPYKARLDSQMKTVIGATETDLPNTRPNGTLGNFIADILKTQTERIIKQDIDFAFTNISGIRLPALPKGEITKGKVFELLPFDNMVIAAQINGTTLKKTLEHIALKGGEAIAGLKLIIKDKQLVAAYVNDSPIDFNPERTYTICTNDFLFNGGDGYTMFKEGVIQQYPVGITIRDMVMDYIYNIYITNGPLNLKPDERITVQ